MIHVRSEEDQRTGCKFWCLAEALNSSARPRNDFAPV